MRRQKHLTDGALWQEAKETSGSKKLSFALAHFVGVAVKK